MAVRVGIGFDIHRLVEGRPLVLGGIELDSPVGLSGHSDGDAVLHAIADAILGAAALGDIGEHFPDTDPAYKDAASTTLLEDAVWLAKQQGLAVGNVDVNVIAEQPRLGPIKQTMRQQIADLLRLRVEHVSVKARTMEGLGPIGQGQAIAAQAIVTLVPSKQAE
jgi:2-C-methyl-D-erythritol 2,4-cyclodiphosphate synthase